MDQKCVNTLKVLSLDMIECANSGHPGMSLGCADILYVLFSKFLLFSPKHTHCVDRDRFVLSNGHGCALLYSLLYMFGYDYTIDDLKNFRQLNSKTPGHPERNPGLGIEVTTGPLGQGVANAVGIAIGMKKQKYKGNVYVMCGDGCLMEGVCMEAVSLAGNLCLNNLIILYDSNRITIDGSTDLTFTENIEDKFKSMRWNVICVDDGHDLEQVETGLRCAITYNDKPTIIIFNTHIGKDSVKQDSEESHGAPLGKAEVNRLKKWYNLPEKDFYVEPQVKAYFDNITQEKINYFEYYVCSQGILHPDVFMQPILDSFFKHLEVPEYEMSTRKMSGYCLQYLSVNLNNFICGSADLSQSNCTYNKNILCKTNYQGQFIHYGVREHAMFAIANGLSTCNLFPFVSTFLNFASYGLAAIRLSALSGHKVCYIFTHDSIALGEDGPTHQPIEMLTTMRLIPGLRVFRPADNVETVECYKAILQSKEPCVLCLSRQNVKPLPHFEVPKMCPNKIYEFILPNKSLTAHKFIIYSTGSEVQLCIDALKLFVDEMMSTNSISMPILIQLFSVPYLNMSAHTRKEMMFVNNNETIISVEAGSTAVWYKFVDYAIGIDVYGKSGKGNDVMDFFGFTPEKLKKKIMSIYFMESHARVTKSTN